MNSALLLGKKGSFIPTLRDNLSVPSSRFKQPSADLVYTSAEASDHVYSHKANVELSWPILYLPGATEVIHGTSQSG